MESLNVIVNYTILCGPAKGMEKILLLCKRIDLSQSIVIAYISYIVLKLNYSMLNASRNTKDEVSLLAFHMSISDN